MQGNPVWYHKIRITPKHSRKGKFKSSDFVKEDAVHLDLRSNKYKLMTDSN